MEQPLKQLQHCSGMVHEQFQSILVKRTMVFVFTCPKLNGLWDMIHLRAEGLHCFSSNFDSLEAKADQMLEEIDAETVRVTCDCFSSSSYQGKRRICLPQSVNQRKSFENILCISVYVLKQVLKNVLTHIFNKKYFKIIFTLIK